MSLLFMDGCDAGDAVLKYASGSSIFNTTTTTRFGVGRAITIGGAASSTILKSIPASTKVVVGYATQVATAAGAFHLISLTGDGGLTNHLNVQHLVAGQLTLFRGSTSIATAPGAWSGGVGAWHYLEVSATINDTTGTCVVRVDGAVVINFTGDTKNGGTNNSIDTVGWGSYQAGGNPQVMDDVYILDGTGSAPWNDFLGDVRIHTLVPTGAGNSTQLTPSTGSNYACVDELPYSASDYVSSSTAGQKDTYATSDLPGTVGTVYGVQVCAVAKKTDAGARSLKTVVRRGSTDYSDSTAAGLGTGDGTVTSLRAVDPSTSAQWTASNVNAMEIGVEVA